MTASERLQTARDAVLNGAYELALENYIWFHHNALSEQPSFYGVRLSYALDEWLLLAEQYPPALTALLLIRDQKVSRLLAGECDYELFNDVATINEYLKQETATYELFKSIDNVAPDFAVECAATARPALLVCGDYALAKKFIPAPQTNIEHYIAKFKRGLDYAAKAKDEQFRQLGLDATEHLFAHDTNMLLSIFRNTQDEVMAIQLRDLALQAITDSTTRSRISSLLDSNFMIVR